MALIKCIECGKEISDQATTCIHCGCPILPQQEPAFPAQQKQKKRNKFAVYLKVLFVVQMVSFSYFLFLPTVSNVLTTISCYAAAILSIPCFVLSILSLCEAKKLLIKAGKTIGVISLIVEIPLILLFAFGAYLAITDGQTTGTQSNIQGSTVNSVQTDWNTFEPSFIGDIPVGCVSVPDATPQNVSDVINKYYKQETAFSPDTFGGRHIKTKEVLEDLKVAGCSGKTIFNFDWNNTLSSVIFLFEDGGLLTPELFQQLHEEINTILKATGCFELEYNLHKDAQPGEYCSCSWISKEYAFECHLTCYFDEAGNPMDGKLEFERNLCEEAVNLDVPVSYDEIMINGIEIYGSYESKDGLSYIEGTATNKSTKTVKSMKIKIALYDSDDIYGKVTDTEWTYVIGEEGLAPGETKKWKVFCSKAEAIKISVIK